MDGDLLDDGGAAASRRDLQQLLLPPSPTLLESETELEHEPGHSQHDHDDNNAQLHEEFQEEQQEKEEVEEEREQPHESKQQEEYPAPLRMNPAEATMAAAVPEAPPTSLEPVLHSGNDSRKRDAGASPTIRADTGEPSAKRARLTGNASASGAGAGIAMDAAAGSTKGDATANKARVGEEDDDDGGDDEDEDEPDGPRRPKSAFLFYSQVHRPKLRAAFPEFEGHARGQLLLTQHQRNRHHAMPATTAAAGGANGAATAATAAVGVAAGQPVLSPPIDPQSLWSALPRLLGYEWRLLNVEQRAPFERLALLDKQRYRDEMQQFKRTQQQARRTKKGKQQPQQRQQRQQLMQQSQPSLNADPSRTQQGPG
jgi:hypothetical protein